MIQLLVIVLLLVLWLQFLAARQRGTGPSTAPPVRQLAIGDLPPVVSWLLPLPHSLWPAGGIHCPYL